MDSRDTKLRSLLPPIESPYDLQGLSDAERKAFEEALGDGFGERLAHEETYFLPESLKSGLLEHEFYSHRSVEFDQDGAEEIFWRGRPDDDQPPPSDMLPIGFSPRRLRIYFANQIRRYLRDHLTIVDDDRIDLDHELHDSRPYAKIWYEFHAIQLLDWIEDAKGNVSTTRYPLNLTLVGDFSGQLGRLIEQYYWRFLYERAALTGLAARRGASAGGSAKARQHEISRQDWERLASEIWQRQPQLSKRAVAEQVRRRSGSHLTAQHIARYIKKP